MIQNMPMDELHVIKSKKHSIIVGFQNGFWKFVSVQTEKLITSINEDFRKHASIKKKV